MSENVTNTPMKAEQAVTTGSIEPGNASIGPGSRQDFRLCSLGIVAALLQWLRDIGLDHLTAHMPDTQRNAILRALLIVLNFGGVLGLSVLMGQHLSGPLLISAGFAAFVAAGGSHVLYTYVQKPASVRYGVPDAPAPKVEPDPTIPTPPTDEPASAALLDIAA